MASTIERYSDGAIADFLTLRLENPNQVVAFIETISRPNIDGFAFRKTARKAKPFHVIGQRNFGTVNYARRAAVEARDALVGELCEIETDEGAIYERLMCLDVTERDVFPVLKLVGGLDVYTGPLFIDSVPSTTQAIAVIDFLFIHAGYEEE